MKPWQRRVFLLLVATALFLLVCGYGQVVAEATDDDPIEKCIHAAPRQFSKQQSERLCLHALSLRLGDGPGGCATSALSGPMSSSFNEELARDLIDLCESAAAQTPGECWSAAPTQMLRVREWRQAIVGVCIHAVDLLPVQCLLEFKRHGLTASGAHQKQQMQVAIEICKSFHGDVDAIGSCLKRAPRSLPEASRYLLCRQGNADAVVDVVDCAKHVLQRNVNAEVVTRVCTTATKLIDAPQVCVLAAHHQLRWMDTESVVHLCQHSYESSATVECAVSLRSWFMAEFPARSAHSTGGGSTSRSFLELARLCHRTVDAAAIVQCVKKLPSHFFTAHQVVTLCGGSPQLSDFKVDCVVNARWRLFGVGHESNRDKQTTQLMALCADATSSAPLDCLVATMQDTSLSPDQRVRLCEAATSTATFLCVRAIQSTLLARLPEGIADAIELCRGETSIAPALCVNELHQSTVAFFQAGLAVRLCKAAASTSPATCFADSPHHFSEEEKVILCAQAESDHPAACARVSLPRFKSNELQARLCNKANSSATSQCASNSPFGMSVEQILALCQRAIDDTPAQCARAVPTQLRVPWRDVAAVCHGAVSVTPGKCLAHRVRQRVPISHQLLHDCRSILSVATSLEIVQFAYECPQLVPKCPTSMKVRMLDQFASEMPLLSQGYVHFGVTLDTEDGGGDGGILTANHPLVQGQTIAPIANGSVHFRAIQFTISGNFTLRVTSPGVEDLVAKLHVYWNESERNELKRCTTTFSLLQCEPSQMDGPRHSNENDPSAVMAASAVLQILLLANRHVVAGLLCEPLWARHVPGFTPLGSLSHTRVYSMPRMAYDLFTGHNIPTATMSSWECLGVPEGSNRSVIRRAYHKRSLEWHPDKWVFGSSELASPASFLSKVEEVYTLINAAYNQLSTFSHQEPPIPT